MARNDYRVITDAAGDTVHEFASEFGIEVIPMLVDLGNGKTFYETLDQAEMEPEEFYRLVREEQLQPTTAQITPQNYLDYFTPILENGEDFIYLSLSSGLSKTYESGLLALQELKEKFPERKMYVIDSLGATGGQGLLTSYVAENRNNGMSIEDNAAWVKKHALEMHYSWTVDDLMHLKRGGRVSGVSAFVGTALNIKPVGHIDSDGHLPVIQKVRGRKAALKKMVDIMAGTIKDPEGQRILISHCDCEEDALALKEMIEKTGLPVGKIYINYVGPVVGAHLGPGGLTLFHWSEKKDR
ncbi:MAG: DegV family protein [Lachnospiraceae bacterium]|nr:DegV family protein [Lachnospiraceae bacterium]